MTEPWPPVVMYLFYARHFGRKHLSSGIYKHNLYKLKTRLEAFFLTVSCFYQQGGFSMEGNSHEASFFFLFYLACEIVSHFWMTVVFLVKHIIAFWFHFHKKLQRLPTWIGFKSLLDMTALRHCASGSVLLWLSSIGTGMGESWMLG